ncbi:MAG: Sua5/YciO/YrdC/YwlC family protein, partial [Pseudomonadota bacterium]
ASFPLTDLDEIRERLEQHVDLIVEGGMVGIEPTTVIDLTSDTPLLVRKGRGDITPFGIEN